jgi:hypothetical protein
MPAFLHSCRRGSMPTAKAESGRVMLEPHTGEDARTGGRFTSLVVLAAGRQDLLKIIAIEEDAHLPLRLHNTHPKNRTL